ncbi:MAG: hypothetical protein ACI87E_002230 [Mariniblastus sp.]
MLLTLVCVVFQKVVHGIKIANGKIMRQLTRRKMINVLGFSALGVSMCGLGCSTEVGPTKANEISDWLARLSKDSIQLGEQKISGLQWQEAIDVIYGSAPLGLLKDRLGFEALSATLIEEIPADRSELFHRVLLPEVSDSKMASGREPHRALITKVAHIKKGKSIPPHGHSNMVSAFLCLSGEFEVRQYDRLEDQEGHMIVRQSAYDRRAGKGTWSSISDYRNNVHWLTAKTDDCFLFTSKIINLEHDRPLKGRVNIDLHRAQTLGTDTFRAPKITSKEAAQIY